MNTISMERPGLKILKSQQTFPFRISLDVALFGIMLFLANVHLVFGGISHTFIFFPEQVLEGQWWRLITFPFVHVSWYHFFLDVGAFWLLYLGLEEKRIRQKLSYVIGCAAGSLLTTLSLAPAIYDQGLCGISGIAHGLMAVSGLELMRHDKSRVAGLVCLLLVLSKSMFEAYTGGVLFEFIYLGLCGSPLATCHAGGVLGGVLAFAWSRFRKRRAAHCPHNH